MLKLGGGEGGHKRNTMKSLLWLVTPLTTISCKASFHYLTKF